MKNGKRKVNTTPYYGFKSAFAIEGDEVIIDYIVMVSSTTSVQDVDTYMATVDTGPNAIIENTSSAERIYPNPVADMLYIDNAQDVSCVLVLNLVGQQVLLLKNNNSNMAINLSELTAGIYYTRIMYKNGNEQSVKFLVK